MKMPEFRKKAVVIEATQWWPGKLVDGVHVPVPGDGPPGIRTLEGYMTVSPGDWIITGVKGEKYPCKPDIFDATYEPVRETVVNWVRLGDLLPGLIFATQNGVLAVKSEYHNSWTGQCMCVLLQSGEYAHFLEGDETLVTALEIAEIAGHD